MSKWNKPKGGDVPRESKVTTGLVIAEPEVVVCPVVETPEVPVHQIRITWVGDVPYCYRCEQGPEVMGDGSMGHQEMRVELDRWVCPRCSSWEKR